MCLCVLGGGGEGRPLQTKRVASRQCEKVVESEGSCAMVHRPKAYLHLSRKFAMNFVGYLVSQPKIIPSDKHSKIDKGHHS